MQPGHKPIVYVAGNHEFFGKRRGDVLAALRIAANETGVHFLDDQEIIIDGVRILGSTLWTDFKLLGDRSQRAMMRIAMTGLNDFRVIHEGDRVFSPLDALRLFDTSVLFLTQKLLHEMHDGSTVVVTHHLPTDRSTAERFKGDELSSCFASNLDHLLEFADVWIHGHTHDSFDYEINGTRLVCNPRGYCIDKSQENVDFNPALIVEI